MHTYAKHAFSYYGAAKNMNAYSLLVLNYVKEWRKVAKHMCTLNGNLLFGSTFTKKIKVIHILPKIVA